MKNSIRGWYRLYPVTGGIFLCVLMLVSFRYIYLQAITPPSGLLTIDRMNFTSINAAVDVKPSSRDLPDDWQKTAASVTQGQYQVTVNLDKKTSGLWGIYLPVLQMNARIYLNEILLGQTGETEQGDAYADPFARMNNPPFYFTLPDNLLQAGENRLTLQVQSAAASGLLGKIYLAEDTRLRPAFNKRYSALITSKTIITAAMLAIAVLMNVLWVLRRQDSVYGWYALMLYTWSAHNIFAMSIDVPFSMHTQNILSLLALGWFVVFMVKATHHYLGQQFPVREKIIFSLAFAGSMMIIFSEYLPWSLLLSHQIWSTFVLNIAGYALLDFTVKYRERDDLQNVLIIPAGFFMLIFGIHDWLLLMEILPRDGSRLLHFAAPVAVSVFGALLLERFAKTLERAESLNLELEQRVAEKHRQLEKNYQRLKQMEHKQLLTEERERFMKEIHDGVGGHLISMLSMVRSGKQDTELLVHAIESTLDDLRIMIDSLTPEDHDIPSLLGAMRARIEPQLESSGLKLHWQVSELPAVDDFGPHKALQVMRIVQEAITNVIRHAGAKNITIKAFAKDNKNVVIEISDDGKGILPDAKSGRGLGNMLHRAKEIGAVFDIKSDDTGTATSLTL
ncbi:MAG: hypothetical protein COA54_07105 [Thiotrichaceae bacterium]|nr:MAG: hypothetical protein COA54_07105 [Thiotrichaceae bacterium]